LVFTMGRGRDALCATCGVPGCTCVVCTCVADGVLDLDSASGCCGAGAASKSSYNFRVPGLSALDVARRRRIEGVLSRAGVQQCRFSELQDSLEVDTVGSPRRVKAALACTGYEAELVRAAALKSASPTKELSLDVQGMTCASCVGTVERAVQAVAGVRRVSVSLLAHRAEVVFEGPATSEEITDAIDTVGFDVTVLRETQSAVDDDENKDKPSVLRLSLSTSATVDGVRRQLSALHGVEGVIFTSKARAKVMYWPRKIGARSLLAAMAPSCELAPEEEDMSAASAHAALRKVFLTSLPPSALVVLLTERHFNGLDSTVFPGVSLQLALLAALTGFVLFWCGQRFHVSARAAVRHRAYTMDVLVSMSTCISFFYGLSVTFYDVVRPSDSAPVMGASMFFETSAVLVCALLFGRLMEAAAKAKTMAALQLLSSKRPSSGTLVTDGQESQCPYDLIQVGDVLRVKPGENVPVDGEIISESAAECDESLLTGESRGVSKQKGSIALGGSTCLSGGFLMVAVGVGNSSTLARIVQLVEDAQAKRPAIQAVVDVVASYFVPAILILSAATFMTWVLVGFELGFDDVLSLAITHGMSVLMIACPCSLGLATPTAVMVATGHAATFGILVKDASTWQVISGTRVVVLDKTGTLTRGRPKVVGCALMEGATTLGDVPHKAGSLVDATALGAEVNVRDAVPRVAWLLLGAEAGSEHPLGLALSDWAQAACGEQLAPECQSFQNTPGKGVEAVVAGKWAVRVGNQSLVGVYEDPNVHEWSTRWQAKGCVVVCMQVADAQVCMFALRDELLPDAPPVVAELQRRGIGVWMCTGDQPGTAAAVGSAAGIEEERICSQASPEDKAALVARLRESWGTVVMVGDGVNDAAAMAAASLGCAIGAGAQVTIDAADAVLVSSRLSDFLIFLDLGRATMSTIYRNFLWAGVFNLVGVPLAAGVGAPWGITLPPVFCGVAMAASSVIVISSSLLLKLFRPRPQQKPTVHGDYVTLNDSV